MRLWLAHLRFGAIALLIGVLALPIPLAVRAATITATNFTDRVNGVCATTGTGDCSLRETTIYANAHPNMTILLTPGTYILAIPPSGADDATTGDLNLTGDTTINVANGQLATIDGNGQDRILSTASGVTTRIDSVTFRNGDAGSGAGGAILNGGSLTLINCTVSGNRAVSGGGIYGAANLYNSTVSNNIASNGGGIYGGAAMTDSTISGNQAQSGGAIYGGADLIRSTLSGNTATVSSPGVYSVSLINGGNISVMNSTVVGNIGPGAALFAAATLGSSSIIDSTIVGNSGGLSQSTDLNASMLVRNTILANSGANCSDRVFSGDYNIVSDSSCSFTAPHDRQNIDPLLGPLALTSGFTQTRSPLSGSPAIDAGSCFLLDGATPITTDQRGIARPQGAACDIGAVEYVPQVVMPPGRANPPPNGPPAPAPPPRSSGGGGAGSGGGGGVPNPLPPSR